MRVEVRHRGYCMRWIFSQGMYAFQWDRRIRSNDFSYFYYYVSWHSCVHNFPMKGHSLTNARMQPPDILTKWYERKCNRCNAIEIVEIMMVIVIDNNFGETLQIWTMMKIRLRTPIMVWGGDAISIFRSSSTLKTIPRDQYNNYGKNMHSHFIDWMAAA